MAVLLEIFWLLNIFRGKKQIIDTTNKFFLTKITQIAVFIILIFIVKKYSWVEFSKFEAPTK